MAVLIAASADVGCGPFSRPYRHRSLYPGCSLLPAVSTMRQSIRLLSVAARSKREIFAVTLSYHEGLKMVVAIVFSWSFQSVHAHCFCVHEFPVDNTFCSGIVAWILEQSQAYWRLGGRHGEAA